MSALNQVTRDESAAIVQRAQTALGRLQMQYSDDRPEFWALLLAWEATRLAWYVVSDDPTADGKLRLVVTALDDFERMWRGRSA